MAETYQILLIEKDKQVADDVSRFLRASAGGTGFLVERQEDLLHGQSMVALSRPDIVIVDASFIDKNGNFDILKKMLVERGVPVLLLSATNGQDLKNKAAMAGAVDYLLKNKLNYFYLPRAILSAIRSHPASALAGTHTDGAALSQLLDKTTDAVIVADSSGNVLYSNQSGMQLLSDPAVISVLRRFLNFKNEQKELKATVEILGTSYELKIVPQDWSGQACTCINIHKKETGPALTIDAKVNLLNEFIQSCTIPFVILVNGIIYDANDSFMTIIKGERSTLQGKTLEDFLTVAKEENINLLRAPAPEMVQSIMGANITTPLELLRKTVLRAEQQITICSLIPPGENKNKLLSPHRLMEIASHDLREPVRTSLSYLHLITEGLKKETGNNKKLLSYAETITAEISRAESMISDMKLLLNINDKVIRVDRLAMMNVIQDVLRQLKPVIDTSDAMVNVSEMPVVKADPDDVKRLLFHLIDNALKFKKKDKRPYIELLAAKDGKEWRFCIKDNGIGIDAKFHTVIFEPFRKLNRVDEYSGAGNGLCICKHIAEAHGGRIWVESHEGFGSSFFFTLPGE
jgi:signal transduction histidine kinase/DNA-binding NarL/FixJ family response regulator